MICSSVSSVFNRLMLVRNHPVQSWSTEAKSKAIAISLHGDEGSGKRTKSIMILSWSPLAVHDASMLSKYPFAAPCPGRRKCFLVGVFSISVALQTYGAKLKTLHERIQGDPQRAVSLWAIWTEHYAGQSAATFGHVAAESKQRGRRPSRGLYIACRPRKERLEI